MTKIPHILYHGTTGLRWASILKSGKMISHMPKYYDCDNTNLGHLYFTDDVQDASSYGLLTFIHDMRLDNPVYLEIYHTRSSARDACIIGIKTSNLKHNFEIDPSMEEVKNKMTIIDSNATLDSGDGIRKPTWYRHKGDIDLKHIFLYRIAPHSQYPLWKLNAVSFLTDLK